MTRSFFLSLVALSLPFACAAADDSGFVPMFNGKDLTGWVNCNGAPETWSVKPDGIIHCTGFPTGAMRTERQYENFVVELEWRHLKPGGNSGFFVWGSPIAAPGVPFLRGIEVQVLDNGYNVKGRNEWYTTHGDVFPIHGATMEPHGKRSGSRSFPTEERSKNSPEWNHYRITGNNGSIRLEVNGKEVSGGDQCRWRKGYLALESEGAPVEFRNVKIKELPSTGAKSEDTAPLDQNWQHLYNGVDLRGWKPKNGDISLWKVDNWLLRPEKAAPVLWTEGKFGDCELIVDIKMPKKVEAGKAMGAIVSERTKVPLLGFGGGEALIQAKPVKAGAFARFSLTLQKGKLIVKQGDDVLGEASLAPEVTAQGAFGIADFGLGLEYGNLYLRSL